MKNKINLLMIVPALSLISIFVVLPALAQSPNPKESNTATASADQEKIEAVREFFKEKVKGENNVQVGEKKGAFGQIVNINQSTLTIETNNGETNIKVASDSALIGESGKKITNDDLEKDMFIIAMGYIDENLDLEARRLVVDQKPETSDKQIISGIVTDISNEEKIITIKNEKSGVIYTLMIETKTDLQKQDQEKTEFKDFQTGDYFVAIGTTSKNENKIINATSVFAIQGTGLKNGNSNGTQTSTNSGSQ